MGSSLEVATENPTGHWCVDCGESIDYTQECVLLQVVALEMIDGARHFFPLFNNERTEYVYPPCYLCFEDWESQYEALREETRDERPVTDRESAVECLCCGSSIRAGEYTGIFTIGEFQIDERSPNGHPCPHFVTAGTPELLCLACVNVFNDVQIEIWPDPPSQMGECSDCLASRCWRYPPCCCRCHTE